MGGFVKREVAENFVALGDGEGEVKKVGGILVRFVENNHFDKPKTDYEYLDKNGNMQLLSGSASLARQINGGDLGKFFKAEFIGWGKSARGKFKNIAVYIWDGEPTDDMRKWPKFEDYYKGTGAAPAKRFEDKPAAIVKGEEQDDDDLPF
jgi:hypothetical protein